MSDVGCGLCGQSYSDGAVRMRSKVKRNMVSSPAWIKGKKCCQECFYKWHRKLKVRYDKIKCDYEGTVVEVNLQ